MTDLNGHPTTTTPPAEPVPDAVAICQWSAIGRRQDYVRGLPWREAMTLACEAFDRAAWDPHLFLLTLLPSQLAYVIDRAAPAAAAAMAEADAAELAAAGMPGRLVFGDSLGVRWERDPAS